MTSRQRRWMFRLGFLLILMLVSASLIILFSPRSETVLPSNYALTMQADFNQPNFYPLTQTLPPDYYRPTGDWVGRLILPTEQQEKSLITNESKDWVWLEVYQAPAPAKDLVGQRVQLSWQPSRRQDYANLVSVDVQFSQAARQSERRGNVLPTRLDGRSQVGPLQSLAAAHPIDDVLVSLSGVVVKRTPQNKPLLEIEHPPLQVPARYYALVNIVAPINDPSVPLPNACPGGAVCAPEIFRVQHYNPGSGKFDGLLETIRIPQQPPLRNGGFASTPRDLAESPVGKAGWYIYGAQDRQGLFTVRAIAPRSLFQLRTQSAITTEQAGRDYINEGNWRHTPERKGTAESVQVQLAPPESNPNRFDWQVGDRALLMHLFGGIGGSKGDQTVLGTVTGHFAYGWATVIGDPFSGEPQFDIQYQQIYAHNPEGIIAGDQTWAMFMGNLQRGWLGSRPVSDLILKLDTLEDFHFGSQTLSPLDELKRQLQIMAARYRTGDGSGDASVTPAASCVQDSNQALYIAISQLTHQVKTNPSIVAWLKQHPNDPQTARFQRLVALSQDLEADLVPAGAVRSDWRSNAKFLTGTSDRQSYPFIAKNTLASALLSWQTVLPRRSYDLLSLSFLHHGASLWFMRTNQVGGWNPENFPLAPTLLFGNSPLSLPLRRLLIAGFTLPTAQGWGWVGLILLAYTAIALPLGLKTGFLRWSFSRQHLLWQAAAATIALFSPAFLEEALFRVSVLPAAVEGVAAGAWILWAALALIVFILYHPLTALTIYPRGYPTFLHPIFLLLTGLLGLACTVAYRLTGSLWAITLIHWLVVVVWLFALGGQQRLQMMPKLRSLVGKH